jgi:hypothetical protein
VPPVGSSSPSPSHTSSSPRILNRDPGFFFTWRDVFGGALWPTTGVGDTISVWIVDVDGTRLFIEAETTKQAGPSLEHEVQKIAESIRFD